MSENILLAYGNKATGATLSGGSWEGTLPLNNIKTGRLSQVARTSSVALANTQFRFDLGANYTLRALALVNHNLSTGALWRARTTDATLDMDFVGPTSMRPRTLTTSGGANGTRVNIYGAIESASCPRYDYSPVNLSSGTATQTISNVPAGTYVLVTTGSNAAVMATGTTVSNSGTIGTTTYPTFVVVNATGNVTLTVLSAATAIHFRESLGLLVEEARENIALYSSAFDNAAWTLQLGASITAGSATGPDGTLSADKLTVASGQYLYQGIAGVGTYTFSCYVKVASGTNQFRLGAYNVTDGTQTSALLTATTQWQRFSLTVTVSADSNWYPCLVDGLAGGEFLLWGAPSLEAGSFPTSYIPTTSAAVTRTADVATVTGSNFSGAHSATAGTLYAQFDVITTVAGTRPIISMDDNSANERFELYASGTDLKFKVVDGGSTVADMTIGTIAANTFYKVAVAWAANDFAASLSGAAVVTDTSGTLPTVDRLRVGANQAGDYLNGHVRRFARWLTRRTNAELQSLATTGPEALGIDTGWQNALRMTFHGDTPANWGEQYPLIATFDATTVRYGTVEIEDAANPDGYVELGQLFVAGGFQPEHNAEYQGFGDGRTDLSTSVKSVGGQKYSTARRRPRTVDFNFPVLEQDEGDHLDEMMAEVGTTEDVLYVPDPADAAKSQRYGFLGTLRELTPLEYPFFDKRAMPLRLEQATLKGPDVTDPTLSDSEIRLNERELAVAKEAARLAIQEITDQFYKQVGKTMFQKALIWIGAIAIGFGLAKGWITFTTEVRPP